LPKKIRIYELARELGLSNEETLELTTELKIGVKSHSSSIEDPQADRVRRLADSEGLRRPTQPEAEPEPAGAFLQNREVAGVGHVSAAQYSAAGLPAILLATDLFLDGDVRHGRVRSSVYASASRGVETRPHHRAGSPRRRRLRAGSNGTRR